MLSRLIAGCLLLCSLTLVVAQETLVSGPAVGKTLPGAFHSFNLNGKIGKDRYHCVVCEFGLNPVVLVFARERSDGKDEALTDLIKKLDEAIEKDQDSVLRAAVIFLSNDARSSATEEAIDDPAKLVAEAEARDKLTARLEPRTKDLKHVVLGYMPAEGPKGYQLAAQAEVTVLLYNRHHIVRNFAFAAGKMTEEDVNRILQGVAELLGKEKKTAPVPPKA